MRVFLSEYKVQNTEKKKKQSFQTLLSLNFGPEHIIIWKKPGLILPNHPKRRISSQAAAHQKLQMIFKNKANKKKKPLAHTSF